jgi:hypothetical protein
MKVKISGILLLCIVIPLVIVACGGGGVAPNGMTGAEILEMSQNVSMDSLQFTAIDEITMMGETMEIHMTGAADQTIHEMYMIETSPELADFMMQIYMVDSWLYMTNPEDDTAWIKTELTDDIWEEQNMASQQMGLMEGFLDARYLGMENIGGSNCYKIDVDPNWDAIFAAADVTETDGLSTEELTDMIKETSCTMWIAENTYFPMQIFFSLTLEMDMFGQQYSIGTDMTMTFSNINQPVTISLPAAARNATEVSYEDFIAGEW